MIGSNVMKLVNPMLIPSLYSANNDHQHINHQCNKTNIQSQQTPQQQIVKPNQHHFPKLKQVRQQTKHQKAHQHLLSNDMHPSDPHAIIQKPTKARQCVIEGTPTTIDDPDINPASAHTTTTLVPTATTQRSHMNQESSDDNSFAAGSVINGCIAECVSIYIAQGAIDTGNLLLPAQTVANFTPQMSKKTSLHHILKSQTNIFPISVMHQTSKNTTFWSPLTDCPQIEHILLIRQSSTPLLRSIVLTGRNLSISKPREAVPRTLRHIRNLPTIPLAAKRQTSVAKIHSHEECSGQHLHPHRDPTQERQGVGQNGIGGQWIFPNTGRKPPSINTDSATSDKSQ